MTPAPRIHHWRHPWRLNATALSLSIVIVSSALAVAIMIVGRSPVARAEPQTPGETTRMIDVYFTSAEEVLPLGRSVPEGSPPLETAMGALLAGPKPAEKARGFGTDVPAGTRLLSARVAPASHRAVVDFSAEFGQVASSVESLTALPRIRQVVFTAQGAVDVESVEIRVAGSPLIVTSTDQIERPTRSTAATQTPKVGRSVARKQVIRGAQQRLVELKFLPSGAVTGKRDYRTQQAVTAFQAWEGLRRDGDLGPKTLAALKTATAPAPKPTRVKGREIQVFRARGVALLVENGQLVRAIHCSTGRPGYTTPAGRYAIYLRETRHWSIQYNVWLPYSQFFNAGYALHEFSDVPAYPASHGCVRMPVPDARFAWDFASIGTPVSVY